jgi:wyosine [tRNA(Phe)-imidazoG37] synthetase (radical SAM superfamily)
MLDSIKGFHLEPTNICTLKCPRCPRTNFIETFKNKNWDNKNLNLDHLKQFIDIDITGLNFGLNGNYGDPIYYPLLFELITYIKSNGGTIKLHTNGSYKTAEWWETLSTLLDEKDIVNFSIDGIPENFTKYRINADWTSIKTGIDIMTKSPAKIIWKYIIFSYNENDIESARQLSKEFGMYDFVINNSDRWEDKDWLKPNKYIANNDTILYNGSLDGKRNDNNQSWKYGNRDVDIDPLCKQTHGMHFISADGYYLPCCFVGDYRFYYSSEFYKNKENYDISKTTISQILTNTKNFYNDIETTKPKYCTYNCPKI